MNKKPANFLIVSPADYELLKKIFESMQNPEDVLRSGFEKWMRGSLEIGRNKKGSPHPPLK